MFDFLKRKKPAEEAQPSPPKAGFFSRLKQGLSKTRDNFSAGIARVFLGKKELTQELLNEIETVLLTADVGFATTDQLMQELTTRLKRNELSDAQAAFQVLQDRMKEILRPVAQPLVLHADKKPFIILVIGVNGSGKTTTIGKLANYFVQDNKQVMLAAGDTFRAAAIEQLQVWGERNHVPVIAQQPGADTAAVIYDAASAAKARATDILIADTAGRLHTQSNLMAELQKVKRVIGKIDPTAPHETLIVLDATLGQNAMNQVKQFHQAIGVTGIALTKLDGTAKGGIIFALAQETKIPIRFIGLGEGIDDLRPFNADDFVDALFAS
jgi:fused signal recognition particle receptor